ncbi:MAG: hypothetical protein AAGG57_03260 [Pseudomonadota bacterium]
MERGSKALNQNFHGVTIPEGPALALKGVSAALCDGISASPISAQATQITVKSLME